MGRETLRFEWGFWIFQAALFSYDFRIDRRYALVDAFHVARSLITIQSVLRTHATFTSSASKSWLNINDAMCLVGRYIKSILYRVLLRLIGALNLCPAIISTIRHTFHDYCALPLHYRIIDIKCEVYFRRSILKVKLIASRNIRNETKEMWKRWKCEIKFSNRRNEGGTSDEQKRLPRYKNEGMNRQAERLCDNQTPYFFHKYIIT